MSEDPRRYLVAYDITQDSRRYRLAKKLQSYGSRAQFSVFLVDLAPGRAVRMIGELERIIDAGEDSVMVCDLGLVGSVDSKRFRYLGSVKEHPEEGPLVV